MNALLNYHGAKWGMASALLQHKGPVILSGYPSELYDRELKVWSRIIRKAYNQNADQRTEVLWCNFEVGQTSLFDGGAYESE